MDEADEVLNTRTTALDVAAEVDAITDQLRADLPTSPPLVLALKHLEQASWWLERVK
jgi:hypothetical protein